MNQFLKFLGKEVLKLVVSTTAKAIIDAFNDDNNGNGKGVA